MRSWLLLGVLVALAACDSGGSSGPALPPAPPWGNFRRDIFNSGASGTLDNSMGCVSNPIDLGGTTLSTPTIDLDNNILIGTKEGLKAYDRNCFVQNPPCSPEPTPSNRCPIWTLTECQLSCQPAGCTPPDPVPIGAISNSPTVTAGNTIVFSTDPSDSRPGRVFAVTEQGNDPPVCNWVYPLPEPGEENVVSRSSAVAQINNGDFTLATAIVGGADGVLRALNADGSVRWEFPPGSAEPITSTPASDTSNVVYIISPDGMVAAINSAGGVSWRAQVGRAPGVAIDDPCCTDPSAAGCADDPTAIAGCFQPSIGVGPSFYAVGSGGALFAMTSIGTQKWQFTPAQPVRSSPAFGQLVFNVGALNAIDTIIYPVDADGTAYAIRDATGMQLQLQRCSDDVTEDCRIDSCPPGLTCNTSNTCVSATGPTTMACSQDTCMPTGVCLVRGRCSNASATTCFLNGCGPNDGECDSNTRVCTESKKPCLPATCPDGGTCDATSNTCTGSNVSCLPTQCPGGECRAVGGFPVAGNTPVQVATSPALTADPFVVIGTADGHVCASWLDGSVPGSDRDPPTVTWSSGCVDLGSNNAATLSSPIIGSNGTIYVTTADGLYKIQ